MSDVSILVHNVSHQDLLLSLASPLIESTGASPTGTLPLAKPLFSHFDAVSTAVLAALTSATGAPRKVIMHPTVEGREYPVGFALDPCLVFDSWSKFKLRDASLFPTVGRVGDDYDDDRLEHATSAPLSSSLETSITTTAAAEAQPTATGVYFPLIAALLPRWRGIVRAKAELQRQRRHPASTLLASSGSLRPGLPAIRHVLVLLSGLGVPRNQLHDKEGNSTQRTSEAIKLFVEYLWPDVEVHTAHSADEVFRFHHNVQFVNATLRPLIAGLRRGVVEEFGAEWSDHISVTMALAGGAPARVAAISAALRPYRPAILHMYELKRLWWDGTLAFEDIDFRTNEEAEAVPPTAAAALPDELQILVGEMRSHYRSFARVRDNLLGETPHDLASFWMRKSKKPVLAVLLVRRPVSTPVGPRPVLMSRAASKLDDVEAAGATRGRATDDDLDSVRGWRYELFRGVNMEVSLPTGSLCSERAAIASALATHPDLRRLDCVAIAVLSVSLLPHRAWSSDPSPAHLDLYPDSRGSSVASPTVAELLPASSDRVRRATSHLDTLDEDEHSATLRLSHPDSAPLGPTRSSPPRQRLHSEESEDGVEAVPRPLQRVSSAQLLGRNWTHRASREEDESTTAALASHDSVSAWGVQVAAAVEAPPPAIHDSQLPTLPPSDSSRMFPRMESVDSLTSFQSSSASVLFAAPSDPLLAFPVPLRSPVPAAMMHVVARSTSVPAAESGISRSPGIARSASTGYALPASPPRAASSVGSSNLGAAPPDSPARGVDTDMAYPRGSTGPADPLLVDLFTSTNIHQRSPPASSPAPALPHVTAEMRSKLGLGMGRQGSDICDNPLAPCGACTEWLRKIRECNPDFRVVTFTDTSCSLVFVRDVD